MAQSLGSGRRRRRKNNEQRPVRVGVDEPNQLPQDSEGPVANARIKVRGQLDHAAGYRCVLNAVTFREHFFSAFCMASSADDRQAKRRKTYTVKN
jgi:hypothetical protein